MKAKVALVTGGARGIGKEIVKRLLASGLIVDCINKSSPATVKGVRSTFNYDLSLLCHSCELMEVVKERQYDVLINNAGINIIEPFLSISEHSFDLVNRVNVRAAFLLMQACTPWMLENRWGRIVNISSIWGSQTREGRGSYSAAKAAIQGLTRSYAAEFTQHGILANCVSPGFIATELTMQSLGKEGIVSAEKVIPAKSLGEPHDIAELVHWLASESNNYLAGQDVVIDGGFSIAR